MASFDAIVIGQGYAGLVVSRLLAARGLKTASVEQMMPGGLIASINELDPGPEQGEHSGPELTGTIAMENMDNGVETVMESVESVESTFNGWRVRTDGGEHQAKNLIVASGAKFRKLGVPGEEEFFGRGVSECADCDGPMYMGQEAVVVGGGDSAFQEAVALTQYADKVTIVMRGSTPRAQPHWVEQATANPKIEVLPNAEVLEIVAGDAQTVEGVRITTGGEERVLPCAGVFVFVGLQPSTAFLPDTVARDENGAIVADETGATGTPGLWAIGAVRSGYGGLLAHADADAERLVAALA